MIDEVFADGVLAIGFANGAVRIDLASFGALSSGGGGVPQKEFRQRLILTAEGFNELLGAMLKLRESLGAESSAKPPVNSPNFPQ